MEKKSLIESLYFYNPWWETAEVPKDLLKAYERPVINDLLSYLSIDRIVVLKGPRRTGKTTLFYQIIEKLLKRGVPPSNILFVSFDDIKLRVDLDEILKAYEEIIKRQIKNGGPFYLLLDEVHFLENWQFHVKKYFDRKYPMKFLVSGSAATLMRKGTESLAGRTVEETILPFSFYEYCSYHLTGQKEIEIINRLRSRFSLATSTDISDLIPYATSLKIAFSDYLEKGGFPNLFEVEGAILRKRLVREDIVEKVIYRDLVALYDIKKPEILEKLFLYLADITSQILSVSNISNSLGLSREYTEKYLLYLEQALLVKRLKKFTKSTEASVRGAEKVHLVDSGLISAFSKAPIGQVLESMVASHLWRREGSRLYYFREKYEVDLVFKSERQIYPIEIKYKDEISRRDLSGLFNFCKKFELTYAIVVTRDLLQEKTFNGLKTVYLPAWLFLLLI